MTRALLEQALAALSRPRPQNSFYQRACDDADVAKAIRAYLHEQPLQLVKHLTAMQALEALDELESSARGDEPFNHAAAPVVRAFIESAMLSAAPAPEPERKPLKFNEMDQIVRAAQIAFCLDKVDSAEVAIIRAVEAHHGIVLPEDK